MEMLIKREIFKQIMLQLYIRIFTANKKNKLDCCIVSRKECQDIKMAVKSKLQNTEQNINSFLWKKGRKEGRERGYLSIYEHIFVNVQKILEGQMLKWIMVFIMKGGNGIG